MPAASAISPQPVSIAANLTDAPLRRGSQDAFDRFLRSAESAAPVPDPATQARQTGDASISPSPAGSNATWSRSVESGGDKAATSGSDSVSTLGTDAAGSVPVEVPREAPQQIGVRTLVTASSVPVMGAKSSTAKGTRFTKPVAAPDPDPVAPVAASPVLAIPTPDHLPIAGASQQAARIQPAPTPIPGSTFSLDSLAPRFPARATAGVEPDRQRVYLSETLAADKLVMHRADTDGQAQFGSAPNSDAARRLETPPLSSPDFMASQVPATGHGITLGVGDADTGPVQPGAMASSPLEHAEPAVKLVPIPTTTSARRLQDAHAPDFPDLVDQVAPVLLMPLAAPDPDPAEPVAASPVLAIPTPDRLPSAGASQHAARVQAAATPTPGLTFSPDSLAQRLLARATAGAEPDRQRVDLSGTLAADRLVMHQANADVQAQIGSAPNSDVARRLETPPLPSSDFMASPVPATGHRITLRLDDVDTGPVQPDAMASSPLEHAEPAVMLVPIPIATSATRVQDADTPDFPGLVDQVAPVLLTLSKPANGSHEMTVRLQPAELGMIQVRIAHALSGATQIEITAEKPATLLGLQRDKLQLHRTLDAAGVPAAGRTLTFHAAAPAHVPANSGGLAEGGGQHSSPGRASGGTTTAEGSGNGGRGGYPAREPHGTANGRRSTVSPETAVRSVERTMKSYRIGLDITA